MIKLFVNIPTCRQTVSVRRRPLNPQQAIVNQAGRTTICAIGRASMRARKREGDGATPRCRLSPVAARSRGPARSQLPVRRVLRDDGWCDDLRSQLYNRACRLPFQGSHERLWREDALYDALVITDHNARPRVRGLGSAIFIHVARPTLTPTEGCLAFPRAMWLRGTVPLAKTMLIETHPRPKR